MTFWRHFSLNLFLRFCFNVFVLTEFHFVSVPTFWWWWRWTGTWPSASRWPTRPGPPPSRSRWLHLQSESFTIGCHSNSRNKCLIKMKQPFYFFYLNKLPNVQDAPIVKTFLLSCQSNSRYKCLIKMKQPFYCFYLIVILLNKLPNVQDVPKTKIFLIWEKNEW